MSIMEKQMQIIGIASDHAGFDMKESLKEFLKNLDYKIIDYGTNSPDSMDYPDVAHPLAQAVEEGSVNLGIALCGSGNGISMTLNKHKGIRAALCWNQELAQLARNHNNANILSLPARFIETSLAIDIVKTFLNSDFEGGRHLRRVEKISCK